MKLGQQQRKKKERRCWIPEAEPAHGQNQMLCVCVKFFFFLSLRLSRLLLSVAFHLFIRRLFFDGRYRHSLWHVQSTHLTSLESKKNYSFEEIRFLSCFSAALYAFSSFFRLFFNDREIMVIIYRLGSGFRLLIPVAFSRFPFFFFSFSDMTS